MKTAKASLRLARYNGPWNVAERSVGGRGLGMPSLPAIMELGCGYSCVCLGGLATDSHNTTRPRARRRIEKPARLVEDRRCCVHGPRTFQGQHSQTGSAENPDPVAASYPYGAVCYADSNVVHSKSPILSQQQRPPPMAKLRCQQTEGLL